MSEQPSEDDRRLNHDLYLQERASWNSVQNEQQKFIDQTILTLAGGALGLSVTFIGGYRSPPALASLLFIGGALLVVSIVGVLASLHFSQRAIRKLVDDLDEAAQANFPPGAGMFRHMPCVNFSARVTAIANAVSSLCLIAGIVCLAIFGYYNESRTTDSKAKMISAHDVQKIAVAPRDSSGIERGIVPTKPAVAPPPPPPPQK